jgi:hypothetical protein
VTKFVVRAMAPAGSAARLGVVKVHTFFLLGDGTYFFFVSDGLQVARLLCGGGVERARFKLGTFHNGECSQSRNLTLVSF